MHLVLSGEVNNEMFEKFVEATRYLHSDYGPGANVQITLNSDGGFATAAVAIVEAMRLARKEGGAVFTITAIGSCQSAATLILAYGDVRKISKETTVMVHEDSTDEYSGKVHEAESFVKQLRHAENQWNRLLAARTNVSAEEWSTINKLDTYLTPEQCLAIGLVDEII